MDPVKSEYDSFTSKHEFKEIAYRKQPAKIFPPSKFDHSAIYSKEDKSGPKDDQCFIYEPLTSIQKYLAEPFEGSIFINCMEDEPKSLDRLICFTSFNIVALSAAIKGRIYPPVKSYVGETFEFIEETGKMLLIGEKISQDPSVYVGHCGTEIAEIKIYLKREHEEAADKIKVVTHDKIILKCKDDGSEFIADRPELVIHIDDPANPWAEFIGQQTIRHKQSKARVEITYKGCYKYSEEDCIEGKIYDSDDKLYGTISGSYLDKIWLKKGSDEKEQIASFKEDKYIFADHFAFSRWTLRLNDPVYGEVKCPTDSRLRGDIQLLEEGRIEDAFKIQEAIREKMMKQEEERKKSGDEYTPKWFKKVEAAGPDDIEYEYTGKYWDARLTGQF